MASGVTLSDVFQARVESPTVRRLLLAATEAFWRDGFHVSSTRDIAKRAQLSPAAVYVHFKAKEDLLFDVIRYVAEHLRDRLREAASKGGSPSELLTRLVHAYVAMPARMYKASLVANREFYSLTAPQRKQIVKIRDELEDIYTRPWTHLVELDARILDFARRAFAITRPVLNASSLGLSGAKTDRIIDLCRRVGARAYLSGRGGSTAYLDVEALRRAGISVVWQQFAHPVYPQRYPAQGFVRDLAFLDLLFNCGPDSPAILAGAAAEACS